MLGGYSLSLFFFFGDAQNLKSTGPQTLSTCVQLLVSGLFFNGFWGHTQFTKFKLWQENDLVKEVKEWKMIFQTNNNEKK